MAIDISKIESLYMDGKILRGEEAKKKAEQIVSGEIELDAIIYNIKAFSDPNVTLEQAKNA